MSSLALPESLGQVVQRFQRLSEPKQRYELLIWFAKRLPKLLETDRTAENKVQGCTSEVYVSAKLEDQKVYFAGDSDSQLVKGLVALLVEGLSGLPPDVVISLSPDFIQATGLSVSLTPSRSNGFYNILRMMQLKALAYQQPPTSVFDASKKNGNPSIGGL
ncbi:MAG: SufE family protein [Thermosynechococcaceae cyanobacterium]